MILEAAVLYVRNDMQHAFEEDFETAGLYISSIKGYVSHSLQKCIEQDNKYLLLVQWERLEDHTIGFRQSATYLKWKALLHHYYDPFPIVEHFEPVIYSKR